VTDADTPEHGPVPFASTCHWPDASHDLEAPQGMRTWLWSPTTFASASCPELGAFSTPRIYDDALLERWCRFELPHYDHPGVTNANVELISSDKKIFVSVKIGSRLPSRAMLEEVAELKSHGEDDQADDLLNSLGYDGRAFNAIEILNLIDRHADLMYRLGQSARSLGPFSEYDHQGKHIRSARRICTSWERIGKSRTPPLSLIVRLAAELPETIKNVCASPRVVLRRVRELQQAARIREVDQSCIRWLGRQPGRTLAEKAGPRQQLMAVVRKEDCDTQENRVVRDLLMRCRHEGRAYLARNTDFSGDDRIKSVKQLVALCEKHLRVSAIGSVRSLVGVAQANYVLQHETRYRVLWDAYLRLVRQEQLTQSVWQWREHVWLEWLMVGFMSSLRQLSVRSQGSRQGIHIESEPRMGSYVNSSCIGPWWLKSDLSKSAYLVRGNEMDESPLPASIKKMMPDLAILFPDNKNASIAIWTVLDVLEPAKTAVRLATRLSQKFSSKRVSGCKLLIVVGGSKRIDRGNPGEAVQWMTVPLMLQDSLDQWVRALSELIEDV